MKKCIFVMMAALLAGCSEHQLTDGGIKDAEFAKVASIGYTEIQALIEKARNGDGQAYLQLADCYKDGIGVQKDFLGMMCMVAQARSHEAINEEKDYFLQIPEDNDFKRCFKLIDKSSSELRKEKDSIIAQLNTIDCPDALAIYGIVCVENGDTIEGLEKIKRAADNGSNFAVMLQIIREWKEELRPNKNKMEQIAENIPIAYNTLGRMCLFPGKSGHIDERQAACYYLKAEQHALLSKREARWLLDYYRDGGDVQLSDEDVKRLESFTGLPRKENIAVADTVITDSYNK